MMSNVERLHRIVSEVCPVETVSIGKWSDKTTWKVLPKPEATEQQRTAALALVAGFDPAATTSEQVNTERDRRLKAFPFGGKSFDFVDDRGSDINIAGAGTLALAAIMAGAQANDLRWADPNVDFTWVAADNSAVTMDAQTTLNFAKAAADWKAKHIYAARALKAMSPIPSDYASNNRWPS